MVLFNKLQVLRQYLPLDLFLYINIVQMNAAIIFIFQHIFLS